jgi:hypothetical protein
MSGTSKVSDAVLVKAIAKRLSDPNAQLTLAEQLGFNRFVGNWTIVGTDATGFPAATGGDVNGWNSLCRTNWFNGRFLTAEALRRQDNYFDYRARLDASALMPGIAYGLGLKAVGLNGGTYDSRIPNLTGGFSATANIVLQPGLAFDMIGRPILVSSPFTFMLEQLIALQKSDPRQVVGGGTQFAPCICLAPDPGGASGGSAAPPSGAYLLIIEAAEKPGGDAKVYGTVCSDNQPVTCQSDEYCAGFGLSLVRFPVDVPQSSNVRSVWDLRGVLSSYFYDVFEHSLVKRWDPAFATDDGFCIGTGPGRKDTGAVALAMVFLGTDGTALWIDSWIPRRSIVATPGEDWHRTTFGLPPRAAAWARIHQFQCMLTESLAVTGISLSDSTVSNLNLLRRGFRHIPPIGFLPIDPEVAGGLASNTNPATGNDRLDAILKNGGALAGIVSGYVEGASRVAESYFNDTNVISYTVVALHDDDVLEDLAKVFDKDPIQLALPLKVAPPPRPQLSKQAAGLASASGSLLTVLRRLATLLPEYGLADLVNRRVEIVKLIVTLQGLTRSHPILDVVAEDAQNQLPDWGIAQTGAGAGAFTLGGLRDQIALDMLPRHFVVYAKQRMVLLDAIFELLELLELLVTMFPQLAPGKDATGAYVSTNAMRTAYQAMPAQRRALAQATLAHPTVQFALSRVLPLANADLAVSTRVTTFEAQVDAQDTALASTVKDATQRRQMALDRVADSYAAVYPGYQFVQLLAATQAPADAEQAVVAIGEGAGALGSLSLAPSATAEDASLAQGIPVFDTPEAAQLFAQLRSTNADKPVSSLVQGVTTTATIGQVLALSPADATQLLGGTQNYAKFRDAYAGATKSAADSVKVVIAPPAGLADKLNAALGQSGGDLVKALQSVRTASGTDAATRRYIDQASSVAAALGSARTGILSTVLTRKA